MTTVLTGLARFAGKHWLRLAIIGAGLFLLSQKQVNFNIRLGGDAGAVVPARATQPVNEETTVFSESAPLAQAESATSLLGSLSIFGGNSETLLESLNRQDVTTVEAFVRRFSNVAQAEQEKFGIPASIILAQSILYSRAGDAEGIAGANAYFRLPCGDDWRGPSVQLSGQCTRSYQNAWTAFRDNSLYLTSGRYVPLKQFGPHDYRRWAAGMEELGLNDTDDLAAQLLTVIDRWQLFQYD